MMNTKQTLLLILPLLFSACTPISGEKTSDTIPSIVPETLTASEIPLSSPITTKGEIEFVSNSEIRFLPTQIDLPTATTIEIPLAEKPVWVAGIQYQDGTAWAVEFEDGSLSAYFVGSSGYREIDIIPNKLPPGMPLTIYSSEGMLFALSAPGPDASPLTQPVLIDSDLQKIAYIDTSGDLVVHQENEEIRLPVNALPDSRILVDEQGKLLVLSNPTDRYAHGVLGDKVEAAGITLVETRPEPRILHTILIPETDVIEGIYPIWTDMNNDGEREIIVTLSNSQDGARIIAFQEDGNILAEGAAIGTGYRWRHQLVVAHFGALEENLLAVVRTPHIGGVVEFYELNGNKLEIVKTISGFSTHSIGSRNLFTAQAGDFNNDGQIELIAPDQNHSRLGIIGMESESITWLDLGAELITNLATAAINENSQVVLAGGLSNNFLKIWLP